MSGAGLRFLEEPSLIHSDRKARYQIAGNTAVAVGTVQPGSLTRHTASEAILITPGPPVIEMLRCQPEDIREITGFDEDGDPVHYNTAFDDLVPAEGGEWDWDVAIWAITHTAYPHPEAEYPRHIDDAPEVEVSANKG
jgi:hypothetical protein